MISGKKILITGINGFIGHNVTKRLIDKNEVVGVDNFEYSSRGSHNDILSAIKFVEGDVSKKETFDKLPKDIDVVLHFGSPLSIILFDKAQVHCYQETVLSMFNILQFARENGVKKVVYPSSGSVYAGNSPPHGESIYPRPRNLYAAAKMACEALASSYKDFVDSVGLRIFAGYGHGEEFKQEFASVVYLFSQEIIGGKQPVIFGDGSQSRDFVFIGDVVDAIAKAAEVQYTGVINVGSGVSTSFNDLVKVIGNIMGKSVEPKYISKQKNYVEKIEADTRLMTRELGIRPTKLENGVSMFLEYLDSIG